MAEGQLIATRRIQFCSGHRVMGHESKCRHLHGHNYVALISARAPLDDLGRVIDFSVLKDRVGRWIDEHWDHGFVVFEKDASCLEALRAFSSAEGIEQKLYLLPTNPTAENMADYLRREVCPSVLSDTGVEVFRVTLYETENCSAESVA